MSLNDPSISIDTLLRADDYTSRICHRPFLFRLIALHHVSLFIPLHPFRQGDMHQPHDFVYASSSAAFERKAGPTDSQLSSLTGARAEQATTLGEEKGKGDQ
jgi:hypothetical protein